HLRIGYQLAAQGPALTVDGHASAGTDGYAFTGSGQADLALAHELLARYALRMPGSLTFSQIDLTGSYAATLPNVRGEGRWGGGQIGYRSGGEDRIAVLPPLTGLIDSEKGFPQMTVYAQNDTTPVLLAHIDTSGMASVGITKQFTKLIGQDWGGSEPDHAVVL